MEQEIGLFHDCAVSIVFQGPRPPSRLPTGQIFQVHRDCAERCASEGGRLSS